MTTRVRAFALALLLAGSVAAPLSHGLAGVRFEGESENADLETQMHQAINRHRVGINRPALRLDPALVEIARQHSRAMAAGEVPVGHARFQDRTRAIWNATRYRAVGENVASNNFPRNATVQIAVDGLLTSPHHRRNLEGDFERTGIGVARDARGAYYFTEVLVR